jgi:hypothetical protein
MSEQFAPEYPTTAGSDPSCANGTEAAPPRDASCLRQAARRSYRWCNPPTSANSITGPSVVCWVRRDVGAFLSNDTLPMASSVFFASLFPCSTSLRRSDSIVPCWRSQAVACPPGATISSAAAWYWRSITPALMATIQPCDRTPNTSTSLSMISRRSLHGPNALADSLWRSAMASCRWGRLPDAPGAMLLTSPGLIRTKPVKKWNVRQGQRAKTYHYLVRSRNSRTRGLA